MIYISRITVRRTCPLIPCTNSHMGLGFKEELTSKNYYGGPFNQHYNSLLHADLKIS